MDVRDDRGRVRARGDELVVTDSQSKVKAKRASLRIITHAELLREANFHANHVNGRLYRATEERKGSVDRSGLTEKIASLYGLSCQLGDELVELLAAYEWMNTNMATGTDPIPDSNQ